MVMMQSDRWSDESGPDSNHTEDLNDFTFTSMTTFFDTVF